MTSSWFFLSTLNYDARSTAHQIYIKTVWKSAAAAMGQLRIARMRQTPHIRNFLALAWAYDLLPRPRTCKNVCKTDRIYCIACCFRAYLTPFAEIMKVTASDAVKLQTTDREMISMVGEGGLFVSDAECGTAGCLGDYWTTICRSSRRFYSYTLAENKEFIRVLCSNRTHYVDAFRMGSSVVPRSMGGRVWT